MLIGGAGYQLWEERDPPELKLFGVVGIMHCFQSCTHCVVRGTSSADENSKGTGGWGGVLIGAQGGEQTVRVAQNERAVEAVACLLMPEILHEYRTLLRV